MRILNGLPAGIVVVFVPGIACTYRDMHSVIFFSISMNVIAGGTCACGTRARDVTPVTLMSTFLVGHASAVARASRSLTPPSPVTISQSFPPARVSTVYTGTHIMHSNIVQIIMHDYIILAKSSQTPDLAAPKSHNS